MSIIDPVNAGLALDADLTLALKRRLAFSVETQSYMGLRFEVENVTQVEVRVLKQQSDLRVCHRTRPSCLSKNATFSLLMKCGICVWG